MFKPIQTGSGCLTLFALPFCGAGLFALYQFVRQFETGPADIQQTAMLGITGLVFAGAGFGLIALGRYGSTEAAEQQRLKQAHPGTPWMWRADWASGRVPGSNRTMMIFAWVFASFWNLISMPMLFFLPEEVIDKGNMLALIGLLFPVVGLGLLFWAVRTTVRWRKFGASIFEMATMPGVIGGRLRGTIQTALAGAPEGGVALQLNSIHRTESRGSDDSSSEKILWQDERSVLREQLHPGYRGITVPVDFAIPYECVPSSAEKGDQYVLWRLHANSAVAGVDYRTQFEIPVFKTAESSARPVSESVFASSGETPEAFDPRRATIRLRPSALGGSEYYFGRARNLGAAWAMTFFTLLWGAILWGLLVWEAPLIFPIAFGLFELLFLVFLADLWLSSTRVVIEGGSVKITDATLGIGSTKEVPCAEVKDVKLGSSMQQHATMTQAGRVYYDIEIHRKYGKKITAGKHIGNKREAEWLVAEMKRQIQAFAS